MLTATDIAEELGEIVAWLRAWEGSEPDVLPEAKTRCLTILNEVWESFFGTETVPQQRTELTPSELADQVKSIRNTLEQWDSYDEQQQEEHKKILRNILAATITFFST